MSSIIDELFVAGTKQLVEEGKQLEILKQGILRGGSSGALILGGKPIGECPRLAYGRFMGLDFKEEPDDSRQLMFSAGNRNEESWYEVLSKTYPHKILREEEIGIEHAIRLDKKMYKVTGRPDIVLLDASENPLVGIELKLICSLWTAKDVMVMGEPKTPHLIQAGFYSWKVGVPFELWYTSHVDWAVMTAYPQKNKVRDWVAHLFPKPGEKNSELLDYTWYRKNLDNSSGWEKVKDSESLTQEEALAAGYLGLPKKIRPFRVGYQLDWIHGQLRYRAVGGGEMDWVFTSITQKGIEDFYRSVLEAVEYDKLPPRASGLKADGTKMSYSPCSYCKLNSVCDSYEGNSSVKEWLKLIK